jgi:hypothetical protein
MATSRWTGSVALSGCDILNAMSTIPEIERAVQQLGPEELAKFREWFAEFDAARWDEQIERDVAAGRLDALAEEALTDLRSGRAKDL